MMQIAWTSQKTRISPQTVPRKKALPKTMMWKKTLTSENGRARERGDVTDLRVRALAFSMGWCYSLRILRYSCSYVVVQGASEGCLVYKEGRSLTSLPSLVSVTISLCPSYLLHPRTLTP